MAIKIAIIGTGAVGTATAYACIMRNVCAEIMLIDINKDRCRGEAIDLTDALSFSQASKVIHATYKEAAQADIIIITAGKPQKPDQPRTELLATNMDIVQEILHELQPINPKAILIMVTNPVDLLTLYAQRSRILPINQIFGSGTLLDSQRLRSLISQRMGIAEESIHAYIIGEHGETAFPVFSAAHVGGTPLNKLIDQAELQNLAEQAKQRVYDIIQAKGYTNYGVASCVAAMCENIIFDQNRIMPTSCYLPNYEICMSIPAAIGACGIYQTFLPSFNEIEDELFKKTLLKLQGLTKSFS